MHSEMVKFPKSGPSLRSVHATVDCWLQKKPALCFMVIQTRGCRVPDEDTLAAFESAEIELVG